MSPGAPARPLPPWDPAGDDVFVCVAVRSVAPDVKTVVLAPRTPSTIRFEAGQYVTIEFDVAGSALTRSYTIASPPTRPERIAITVKRTDSGAVSGWLHDDGLRPGTLVRVGEPRGSFTRTAFGSPAALLLTAGAGITPALSMLRESYDLGAGVDLVLVHSQRRLAEVPYGEEVTWIARQLPGLRVRYVCSAPDSSAADSGVRDSSVGNFTAPDAGRDDVVTGRLTPALLAGLVPDASGREVFICGPDGYRAVAQEAALAAGASPERIHLESFRHDDPIRPAPQDLPDRQGPGGHQVRFSHLDVTIRCPEGMTVLAAATAAGLMLPSSCAQGLCGTCKGSLRSGEVDMQHAGGIRPREIAAGKILLCCSRPLTDLVISD